MHLERPIVAIAIMDHVAETVADGFSRFLNGAISRIKLTSPSTASSSSGADGQDTPIVDMSLLRMPQSLRLALATCDLSDSNQLLEVDANDGGDDKGLTGSGSSGEDGDGEEESEEEEEVSNIPPVETICWW